MRAAALPRSVVAAFAIGGLAGGLIAGLIQAGRSGGAALAITANAERDLAALKTKFRRPATVPFPANNPFSQAKRALGEALFHDKRLSSDQSIACATCHARAKGFADGRPQSLGVPRRPLARHTPTLWNLAWGAQFFWDGRARSLEEQVVGPIESPDEMNLPMAAAVERLARDPGTARAFAQAFPETPQVSRVTLAKALATYERTFVSPQTRFDRWVEGDKAALTPQEVAGFRLFAGKAQCTNCHSGFAFTDHAFHDIGLPGEDRGRGAVLGLDAARHAFKTPGLREIGRSAPYMHDGSLKTLDAVVRHYERGVVARPTLSADLPRKLALTKRERADLVAFLKTLDAPGDPQPPAAIAASPARPIPDVVHTATVSQDDKAFAPRHIAIPRGARVWIVNNDKRTHNVRIFDPRMDVDSGAQEPGETVAVTFSQPGRFLLTCGIHPKMELWVDVQ